MYMDGRAVFRWAVAILCDTIQDVFKDAQFDARRHRHLYSRIRPISASSTPPIDVLKIPRTKVYNNLDKYGNTSAGSIPLVVDEAMAEGRLKAGRPDGFERFRRRPGVGHGTDAVVVPSCMGALNPVNRQRQSTGYSPASLIPGSHETCRQRLPAVLML